jgi:hypothetical protein
MVRHPLFASLASVVVEFETKTKSLYGDPNEGQYANIKALLGITDIDVDCLLAAADTYIELDEMEFYHHLRSMFALGFLMAVYAVEKPSKQDVYH